MESSGLLGDLAVFARVVAAGSVSAAAVQLGASKSTISARVAALEEQIGARLLIRSRQGVRPTAAGERLVGAARGLMANVEAMLAGIRADEGSIAGTLRITCTVGVADAVLVPLLAGFMARHPALSLDVVATDLILDQRREGVEVAFRFGWLRRPEQGFIARRIATYEGTLCASPAYLGSAGGAPQTPAALASHAWISSPAFGGMRQLFVLRDRAGQRHEVTMTCRVRTTAPTQQREWALAGLGITRLPQFLVAGDLEAGALVCILPAYRYEGPSLYAVYAREHARSARVRALLTYVQEATAKPRGR